MIKQDAIEGFDICLDEISEEAQKEIIEILNMMCENMRQRSKAKAQFGPMSAKELLVTLLDYGCIDSDPERGQRRWDRKMKYGR